MLTIIMIVAIVVALVLMLIVLIQNPKGGGLSSQFTGVSNQVFGAKQSAEGIEKLTWYLGIALLAICIASAVSIKTVSKPSGGDNDKNKTEKTEDKKK